MNNTPKPFVSVIIPVHNDLVRLKLCLKALGKQAYSQKLYEVIVVNNNPSENIEPHISHFKNVRIICESQRCSYAARNKGVLNAKGTVIAFTDSDCIPKFDWIEQGVSNLLREPHCGLIAGRVDVFISDPKNATCIELLESCIEFQQKRYIEKERFGVTANLFTFKDIFSKVGYFNDKLLSSGDYEWGNRVFNAGYRQVFVNDICVLHPARKTFRQRYEKIMFTLKWRDYLGLEKFSLKSTFINLLNIKNIIFTNKYDNKIKGKRQKCKLVFAGLFEIFVSEFGKLIVKYLK